VALPALGALEVDPRRCEIALDLLAKKWLIPILVELDRAPRRRKYLFVTLKISSSRLDPTIQAMTRWGVIERTWIPSGHTDGPGLAITELGRDLLVTLTTLSAWQSDHQSELLANNHDWTVAHEVGQV
jgi:DNA-binding HxlR family transcriptional regulator